MRLISLTDRARSYISWALLGMALMLVFGWWAHRGIPYALEGSALAAQGKSPTLPCVSYSPFRHREGRDDITPFNYLASVSASQIETDLRILKTLTNCVRTYGLAQGLDGVPAVARKLGMRLRLGVWLSRDEAQNRLEIDRGIQLARDFSDVVDLLIVGNEALLRRELSPEALGRHLNYARQLSPVPISYADVWEFWLQHASLARYVDLVTVHILPYWEDDPVAVEDSVNHVFNIASQVQKRFADKPIWIGETGWPAAGRQRAGAVPGKVQQSRFLSELAFRMKTLPEHQHFNVIEGFDQPWKRSFEGAMGGYWGLFDQFGHARVQLSGTVIEDKYWWRGWVAGLLAGLLVWGVMLQTPVRTTPVLSGVLTVSLLGAMAPVQWLMMQQWDRSPRELAVSVLLATVGAVVTLSCFLPRLIKVNQAARTALMFCAATAALVLLLESRYRPFAWWWFLAPTAALLAQRLSKSDSVWKISGEQKLLAAVLIGSALLMMWHEGWSNQQALSYGVLLILLACAVVWPSRTITISANNAAGAQSSVV